MRDDVIGVKKPGGSTAMATATRDRPPPASLRLVTQVTGQKRLAKNVRVRTQRPWRREKFFTYLEQEIAQADPPIPHVTRLAEMAGISPSTISNWKTGKQRPTLDKLTAIARVLGKPRREVWLQAGLVDANDVDGEEPEEADPRLHGLDPNSPAVRHIMSLEHEVDEETLGFMLDRQREIDTLRAQQDIAEIELIRRREQERRRTTETPDKGRRRAS